MENVTGHSSSNHKRPLMFSATLLRRCILTLAVVVVVAAATTRQAQPSVAALVPARSGPLVFFQTFKPNSIQRLRGVLRVDPRSGRNLPPITLPTDSRTFVDATQVGDTTFLVWASNRGALWLAAAGRTGRMSRRWRVGRAGGFEVRPVPDDPTRVLAAGFVRVSADARYALLVNGQGPGPRRIGRYVDLRSGTVRYRQLPRGVYREVADAAPLGHRFVLVGYAGAVVTVGSRGEVVARAQVKFTSSGPQRIGFVNVIALPRDRAVLSFITGSTYRQGTRRSIARYDAKTGELRTVRSYADRDGYEFAATQTRFVVFGDYHWTAGRIDGGPLRQIEPLGPGARPPAVSGINPAAKGQEYVLGSATGTDGQATVLRTIVFANSDDRTDYNAIEAVEVDIRRARVLHRTRFADDADRPSRLPYALDVRVS